MPQRLMPTVVKLARGNPGRQRINRNEPKPTIPDTIPDPPSFLNEDAVAEWQRVAPELHRMKLLSVVDIMPLASYCQAYSLWKLASEKLQAELNIDTDNIVKARSTPGVKGRNPLLDIIAARATEMNKYAAQFGFTPASRSHIGTGAYGNDGTAKFSGLLGGSAS